MKIAKIGYEYIEFDNGQRLTCEHQQDCCEQVYADFENMQVMGVREKNYVYSNELDFFPRILDSIVPIADLGFYIVTMQGICLLVSCYNLQNGYYSSNLELRYMGKTKDISDCVPEFEYYDESVKEAIDKKIRYLERGEDWRYRQEEKE